MNVHPFANRFPMLPQEQLEELAADIAEHGQVYPIIVDGNGQLLDGRNRLAACKLAGVEPRIDTWQGDNPEEYILSVNVHRRHIPQSVRVMAIALVNPEPGQRGRRKKNTGPASIFVADEVDSGDLARARAAIREFGADSDAVNLVMAGGSLKDVYQQALEQKRLREEFEQRLAELRKLIESVGSEVSVSLSETLLDTPVNLPEFAKQFDRQLFARVEEQQAHLGFLVGIQHQLEEFLHKPVVDSGWLAEGYLSGVLACASHIIKVTQQVAETHRHALNRPRIRKVK